MSIYVKQTTSSAGSLLRTPVWHEPRKYQPFECRNQGKGERHHHSVVELEESWRILGPGGHHPAKYHHKVSSSRSLK